MPCELNLKHLNLNLTRNWLLKCSPVVVSAVVSCRWDSYPRHTRLSESCSRRQKDFESEGLRKTWTNWCLLEMTWLCTHEFIAAVVPAQNQANQHYSMECGNLWDPTSSSEAIGSWWLLREDQLSFRVWSWVWWPPTHEYTNFTN